MRGVTRRRVAVVGTVTVVLAGIGVWNERRTLADGAIASELARRGVRATYRVADIGFRWERLENIVIGDPRHPDLTADWAEVRVAATLGGLSATEIRAGGVKLRGRLVGGKVKFGDIDKLIPASSGVPFTLPDITVDLADARIALATDYGNVGARLDGQGNLSNGFKGKLAAIAPTLVLSGCRANRATLYVDISISARKPTVTGPLRANAIDCGAAHFRKPALALNVALSEALDHWRGTSTVGLKTLSLGSQIFRDFTGWGAFEGSPRATNGSAQVMIASSTTPFATLAGMSVDAKFGVRGSDLDGRGTVKAMQVVLDRRYVAQLKSVRANGTPVGPLLKKLSDAASSAIQNLAVSVDVGGQVRGSQMSGIVTAANITTLRGMKLVVGGGQGVRFGAQGLFADTQAKLSGGGFPTIAASFRRGANGVTSGVARIEPYAANDARLTVTPVQFTVGGDGRARVLTTATLDGPLGNGRVIGLQIPLVLALSGGNIALNPGCTPAAFRSLSMSGLHLDPNSLKLCANNGGLFSLKNGRINGGATIISPRLTGRLGNSPIVLGAGQANVALSDNRFTMGNLGVKLGAADHLTTLEIGALNGAFVSEGVTGKFENLSGKIANVPLLIDSGVGNWTFNNGVLTLGGRAGVSDEAKSVRFNTLVAEDVKLRLASGKIAMTGMLREVSTNADVSAVAITHDLGNGRGHATLDVAGLNFGKTLQPEKLTPLTLGVVANVAGSVSGKGQIDWSSAGVTSTGRFETKGLDFAAAFGPVAGLSGEIVFTDLLGLVTAPGQTVSIATINPGIPVPDGRVTYHLAAGQRIIVEGGRWPFAGGSLILDPTTLDMGVSRERRLTFRVDGLDAAKFIQQLEFENLSATGIFDGAMPMIFDDQGGRIVGGKIAARSGGGTLSYVGDVSNAKMNVFAKLAFDALKGIRYNNLVIEMDGALDGEIVSKVSFRGVNEAPRNEKRGYFARQFSNLPFIFNIAIRAPFRGLLATARTFQDPSSLLRGLPIPGATVPDSIVTPVKPIQPSESEKRP
jgi:translocation and assembly module TamB